MPWPKMAASPVMVLSAVGVLLCLSFYIIGVTGAYPLPARETPILFGGLFAVWIPIVILSNRLTQDFKQKDFWKAALRGCPAWMRAALWVVIGCVFAVFLFPRCRDTISLSNPGSFMIARKVAGKVRCGRGSGLALQLRHIGFCALRLAGGALDEFKKFPQVFLFRQFRL